MCSIKLILIYIEIVLNIFTDWFEVATIKKILERKKKATKKEISKETCWKKNKIALPWMGGIYSYVVLI